MARERHVKTGRVTKPSVTGLGDWNALTAGNVNVVVLSLSKDPNPKTTMLVFRPESAVPWAAAKLPSTHIARAAVARESTFLAEVHQRFSADVLRTIPRRLTAFENGMPPGAMVVQAFGGTPLSLVYARRGHLRSPVEVGRDFAHVARWLREIQTATIQSVGPIALGGQLIDGLRARHSGDRLTAAASDALASVAKRFEAFHGPKTVVHGDLWLGNILVGDAGVTGVIDWESAQICGEPLRDVARFALTYALYLDRTRPGDRIDGHCINAGEWGAGVDYLFTGAGWLPELIREFLRQSLSRLGADPACWPGLLLLGLADVAATADDDEWAHRHLVLLDRLKDVAQ